MAIDLIEGHTHEGIALGNVNGVDGYVVGGAGNDTLDVVAVTGGPAGNTQALSWQAVAGLNGSVTFYEQTLASARAASARYRFSFWARVNAGAGSEYAWISLTDAAFNSTTFATCGLRIALREEGAVMGVAFNDNSNTDPDAPTSATPIAGTDLDLGTWTLFVVEVNTDDTFELWADQGAGRQSICSGKLISGNEGIVRYSFWQKMSPVVSSTIFYDDVFAVTPRADTPATLRSHRQYFGEITAATSAGPGQSIAITVTVYSAETLAALATFDDSIDPLSASGEPKDDGRGKLDAAVQKALQLYGAYANVSAIIGHEVEF